MNYNSDAYLKKCVLDALPQVREIVLVDNASTDASTDSCSRHFTNEPKLTIIRNTANLGFAAACNIGSSTRWAISYFSSIQMVSWMPLVSGFLNPRDFG
ncbi:MAG: glycosyltransferase [Burkholderiales bacterium]